MINKGKCKVLIVDRLSANRSCLRVLLKFYGFKIVIEQESLKSAILLMQKESFDLVIIDISSKEDELLISKFRKWEKAKPNKYTKIISSKLKSNSVIENNIDGVIKKPLNQKYLYNSLEGFLL